MRYAYAITTALLVGGAAITMGTNTPVGAQTAQNDERAMLAAAPRAGAPMSFADLTARLQPSVVNISTKQTVQVQNNNPFAGTPFQDFFGQRGNNGRPVTREAQSLGSGFIISADGYIVTNNHVVAPGNRSAVVDSITVTLPDRKEYEAKLIGRDPASDLALLKINATNLPFVTFGDSTQTRVGDWIVAIGNPFGLGGTVTAGIVSALHRNTGQGGAYDRYIQTDASINFGNSGGPMFDLNGNVIGINSAIFSPTGGNVGIGFAIPAEQAKPIIDTLKAGERVQRGYLGVGLQPIDENIAASLGLPKNVGELIARVEPNEGAAKAGIQQGDVITKVNNTPVTPDNTLSFLVANTKPGQKIPIELYRGGKRMTVTATVGQRPPEEQLAAFANPDGDAITEPDAGTGEQATRDSLGLAVQTLTPQIQRQLGLAPNVRGVVVGAVDPSSDAANSGIQRGDIILSANQRPTTTADELNAQVRASQTSNRPVLLLVQRGNGAARYVGVKLKAR
ncbi:DegQ family serine endoprotease [Sphingomonas cavernae]|uniref:Probable periplasmic serine endoprotease DegP-like n=1 Tax=Sphingomonas cavernae TaxID=2320861 RepID=A0A418W841_9SPHN|nr:DegQ family serine endoprotease [Sphingomonas cavernae]RJF86171.1 DegQ family serine endoprotease [Sphingomonas cavernae]